MMLRTARLLGRRLPARAAPARVFTRGAATEARDEEHVLLTEQEQGHLMEKLQDPQEVARLLHTFKHHGTTWGMTGETMADTILRETLEAQQVDMEARMNANRGKDKVLCEHGHEHDFCCGASKDEVQGEE